MIHGIARGTAQVTIKQNGYDIYNSTVPPGLLPSMISMPQVIVVTCGNDSNLLIVFYVQIMPDDLVMQLHRF
ncbi:outer membrane usher protein FimD [Escherichia coli]|uniref:Outer membrane usher protein FimD n=1 Tax=Escherichia coli TaxID=562 RepID=A0A376NZS1_ECOLX|nr:outer membrane usher protein FimD [Escherichia coli]